MEVVFIHRLKWLGPQEMMAPSLEIAKKIEADPGQVVPGKKNPFSYRARGQSMVICL